MSRRCTHCDHEIHDSSFCARCHLPAKKGERYCGRHLPRNREILCPKCGYRQVPTMVVFRKDVREPKRTEIVAVFPELQGTNEPGTMACYARVGQHSSCHISWYFEHTKPATPEEYAPLKAELESIGYYLDVRRRRPSR